MVVQTGAITKTVRNSDSPRTIWFGGICGIPMALRANESTIVIRMKEVTIIRMAGTRLSTVSQEQELDAHGHAVAAARARQPGP